MAITYLGSTTIDANSGDGSSTTETIPSGATLAVISLCFFDGGSGPLASVTVDGQLATNEIAVDTIVNDCGHYLGRASGFSTGTNKTISWTWTVNQGVDEGGRLYITYWSGADVTQFSDFGADPGGPGEEVQVTVTTAVNEVVVTQCQTYTGSTPVCTPDGSPTLNSVYDDDVLSAEVSDIDYWTRTQTTHVIDMTGEDYAVIIAAVLKEAAAGGSTPKGGFDGIALNGPFSGPIG